MDRFDRSVGNLLSIIQEKDSQIEELKNLVLCLWIFNSYSAAEGGRILSSNAIPQSGQAIHTKAWVDEHKKVEPVAGNTVRPKKKDSFEVWMDRIGKTLTALAVIFGAALVVVQVNKLLG